MAELVNTIYPPLKWLSDTIRLSQVDGLLYLKQNRIVHRDIKPENLMIDLFGHIVIVDFGLALMFEDDEPEIAQSGRTVCGTPGYIAPELMDGNEYSYAVDVWSAGCVMYELLVGRVSRHLKSDYT